MTVILGTLSTGGASDLFSVNDQYATRRQASASGNVDTMRMTCATSASCLLTLCLWADSSGSPGALLGQTNQFSVVSGTNSGTMVSAVAVTSGTFYWCGIWVQGASLNLTDNTPGGYSGHTGQTGAPANPFGSNASADATNSLPITGEDTGLGGAVPFVFKTGVASMQRKGF